MRKPAKIGLGIFGSVVAIIVLAGVASAGNTAPASTAAAVPATAAAPSTTPVPTTTASPMVPTADELFVGAVVDSHELVGVGRSICDSIGLQGVTHAALVGELGAAKWGAAMAEAVVTSAEVNLCPERRYAVPTVAAPAPAAPPTHSEPAPSPRSQPRPQAVVQPEPAPAPRKESAPREDTSVYYKNCAAARAAGAAPLHVGDPGYRGALDRDKDGVACE